MYPMTFYMTWRWDFSTTQISKQPSDVDVTTEVTTENKFITYYLRVLLLQIINNILYDLLYVDTTNPRLARAVRCSTYHASVAGDQQ